MPLVTLNTTNPSRERVNDWPDGNSWLMLMDVWRDLVAINNAASSGGGGSAITAQEGITAFAGGGQVNATACVKMYNYIDTVASSNDSIIALAGTNTGTAATFQFFQNNGANDLDLYPQPTENFIGLAANTPITIPVGGILTIVCATTGTYRYF